MMQWYRVPVVTSVVTSVVDDAVATVDGGHGASDTGAGDATCGATYRRAAAAAGLLSLMELLLPQGEEVIASGRLVDVWTQ